MNRNKKKKAKPYAPDKEERPKRYRGDTDINEDVRVIHSDVPNPDDG